MLRSGLRSGLVAAAVAMGGLVSASQAADVQIKFWTINDPGRADYFKAAIEAFKDVRPDIKVVHEEFPVEAYKTGLQVALNGSEPPDAFFNWVGEDSKRLIKDGLALDISAYGKGEAGFQSVLSEGWLAPLRSGDGLYGVPYDAVSKYFYYNKSFFAEHKLSEPNTFGELLQICRDVRAINANIVPMPLGNSERWKMNHFITMLNERVVGSDATADDYALTAPADKLFTNPRYVEALDKVLELQKAGCFQDAPNATAPDVSRTMFSAGASPMIYCGTWCPGIFEGDGFTDFAAFRMPKVEGGDGVEGSNFMLVQAYQVATKSAHPEETVEWLSFLVSAEMGKLYAEKLGQVPSNPGLISQAKGVNDMFRWTAEDFSKVTLPVNVLDVLLENSVSEAYLDVGVELLNGTVTSQEAMARIRDTALKAQAKQ